MTLRSPLMDEVPGHGNGTLNVQSGGSTGAPKQLARPIHTWLRSAEVEERVFAITPEDRFAVMGSNGHSLWAYAEFRAQCLGAPFLGVSPSVILHDSSSLQMRWSAVAPSVVYGVPELVAAAARRFHRRSYAAVSVRIILLGGGPVPPSFPMSKVHATFPNARIWSFYGSAEASFIGYAALGSPYKAFPTVQLTIQESGEIWVQSPMTITPSRPMFTGDLGQWASEGGFHVLGRAARQLVVKGEKYVVEPLERALMSQFGGSQLALMADGRGRVVCVLTRARGDAQDLTTSKVAGVDGLPTPVDPAARLSCQQLNAVLRSIRPDFPGVRRIALLDAAEWPLTLANKTDFLALQEFLDDSDT